MVAPHGLCIGLDPDISLMPPDFRSVHRIVDYFSIIINQTRHVAKAYKINTAFFEQYGLEGMQTLYKVRELVGSTYCVIDAKRADIGNTSAAYARSVFTQLKADAATVAPYMGHDSVAPFLDMGFTYILALTSNAGSADFQRQPLSVDNASQLFEYVIRVAEGWKGACGHGYVVGATHPKELMQIREWLPNAPLLLPGIGAQGADATTTAKANGNGPALFNVGRAILYASNGNDFAEAARTAAEQISMALSH